ncbi:MAG: glycosyltransferase family 4 protein [Roseibacillus sp.]|nr:glycosyltransferase family 4 protein [Roseibacillus sp.]MDP6208464.1 glycosyltransferase family 4 protein [Roseibacillus sp.]MDP7306033.1 glycosyltransferase family 4 protein [Roseibacillus sp.]MDP7495489.1 glycosyltransferase family 4 protein [Roseibacillus sp.]HJM64609.1 glycosyltransferase family 4 protein [Roseibacillus sp.]|tara:strand:+ start:6409 stop:7767 length:1359 start_codon:yes stop_codon:yes gene_type:complete
MSVSFDQTSSRFLPFCPGDGEEVSHLVLVVRADPIICGHSTEARNLAEAAIEMGLKSAHIVSYPIDVLGNSGLPLKPLETISQYSDGIEVSRPAPVGDYKVLDGRLGYAISGEIVDLLHRLPGRTMLMDLYLVPHGQMVMNAVQSFRTLNRMPNVYTVGEAVGSDITNVVRNALDSGQTGTAQVVLSNYLDHDLPVAVSEFTRGMIVESGEAVDAALGTDFASRLRERVEVSFPAIDTTAYASIEDNPGRVNDVLGARGLKRDGYVMFLSRISPAKGVDDLLAAYRQSELHGSKKLIICGNGPMKEEIRHLAAEEPAIEVLDDVSDEEKGALMHGCYAWCLPSKPRPEFVETFGIAVAEKMLAGGLGPVITTRTGGIPEATGGHCLEHEAGNISGLLECLNRVAFMQDAERADLARRARQFAVQFDRRNVLKRLLGKAATTQSKCMVGPLAV